MSETERKTTHHAKENGDTFSGWLLIKDDRGRKTVKWPYLKFRRKNKICQRKKFYTQQYYPSKMKLNNNEGEIKTSPDKQNRNTIASRSNLPEMLKGVLQAKKK